MKIKQINKGFKAHQSIILLIVMLLVGVVLSVNIVSGFQFDNVASFDKEVGTYGKMTITNAYGLGSKIMDIELTENTFSCANKCQAIKEITLYEDSVLVDNIRFLDLNNEETSIRDFKFYINSSWETVNDYEWTCEKGKYPNGTEIGCYSKLIGNHPEPVWTEYDGGEVKAGSYQLKLIGYKNYWEAIDWQIEIQGIWTTDWALWNSADIYSYWKFDELTGTIAEDRIGTNDLYFINLSANLVPGLINNGFNQTNTLGTINKSSINWTTDISTEMTFNLWINQTIDKESDTTDNILTNGNLGTNGEFIFQFIGNNLQARVYDTGSRITSSTNLTVGNWEMITFVLNNSNLVVYVNATEVNRTVLDNFIFNGGDYNLVFFSDNGGGVRLENVIVDEMGLWKRSLTEDEITELYNEGAGLTFGGGDVAVVISEDFNATTLEVTPEGFVLNLTYNSTEFTSISSSLFYNFTTYASTKVGSGDSVRFEASITTPKIVGQTNISFHWISQLSNVSGVTYYNSSAHIQTVNEISVDNCSTHSILLLNFTLKGEEVQSDLTANTTIKLDLTITSPIDTSSFVNFSIAQVDINPVGVCLSGNLTGHRLDAQVSYTATGFAKEFYHIQNFIVNPELIPQNINLFALNITDSTNFLIIFKDENFLPVNGALIDITRKYVDEGVFKTVEIPKADTDGQAIGHFDTDGVLYTIIVSHEGVVLATFDNIAVICQDVLIGECKLNLNAVSTGIPYSEWSDVGNLTYTMTFNKDTKKITTIFTTTDGSSKIVSLNATKFDRFGNTTVCSDSLTSASGTLICTVPDTYGNSTVIARLYSNGGLVTTRTYSLSDVEIEDIFGKSNGAIMLIIFLIGIPLMFITSTIGIVLGVITALIFGGLLSLFNMGSWTGAGSLIIWLLISGGIIIWKISQREE